jgi:hypothetical protein
LISKSIMKKLTLILFFITTYHIGYCQYRYIQKLGNLGTIALPDTPKLVEKEDVKIYLAKYRGVTFLAGAGDISGGLKDIFKKNNLDSLYNKYIEGTLSSTKGKVFYRNRIKINGHDAVEFGYKFKPNKQLIFTYNRVVALNDTILTCGIIASDSLSKDQENLKTFFNGFKTVSKKELSIAHAAALGYKMGTVIGVLIVIAIPLLLGLCFVFIIRKIAYRKKS